MYGINRDILIESLKKLVNNHGVRKASILIDVSPASYYNYLAGKMPNSLETIELLAEKSHTPLPLFFETYTRVVEQNESSCTASQTCQELCHICADLPEQWQEELLEYAKYLQQKKTFRGGNNEIGRGQLSELPDSDPTHQNDPVFTTG